jgi:hypothetical protein
MTLPSGAHWLQQRVTGPKPVHQRSQSSSRKSEPETKTATLAGRRSMNLERVMGIEPIIRNLLNYKDLTPTTQRKTIPQTILHAIRVDLSE